MSLTSGVGRLGDISTICSHCCLIVHDHMTCLLVVVEVWTKF
jgi:hypothetical protein